MMFPSRIGEPSHLSGIASQLSRGHELEKECIQLYFSNLYVIYSFMDQTNFLERCKREIWETRQAGVRSRNNSKPSQFPALYSAVLAVGALTAGDDAAVVQDDERVQEYLTDRKTHSRRQQKSRKYDRPSFELAHFFHNCTKTLLGDIFESSSLESSQTLLLMVS